MSGPISDRLFLDYLQCKYKAYLKLTGKSGTKGDYEKYLEDQAGVYRRSARKHFLQSSQITSYSETTIPFKDLIKQKPAIATDVLIADDRHTVLLDAAELTSKSAPQKPVYQPVMFLSHQKITKKDKLSLAFCGLALSHEQKADSNNGWFIFGDKFSSSKVQLQALVKAAGKIEKDIFKMMDAQTAPPLRLNDHCKICEFQADCLAAAKEKDDLSLLKGLSGKEIDALNKRGIFTVTQYSYSFRPKRARKLVAKKIVKHHHSLNALALRTQTIYIAAKPELPTAPTRVYFDVEGIPDENFYYLIGLLVDDRGSVTTHSLWADNKAEERNIWKSFLEVIAKLDDFAVFHYGSYEAKFMKQMETLYGGNSALLEKLLSRDFNVLSAIYGGIYFPTYSNDLKSIATFMGYKWSHKEMSGLQSIVWRHMWEKEKAKKLKRQLIAYNREDCIALQVVYAACEELINANPNTKTTYTTKHTDEIKPDKPLGIFKRNQFVFPELETINKKAYWDYQQEKIYLRQKTSPRFVKKKRVPHIKAVYRINRVVIPDRPKRCPKCNARRPMRHMNTSRIVFDLKMFNGGIKRWVTKYDLTRYMCKKCRKTFTSIEDDNYSSLKYGNSLVAWIVYQSIGRLKSQNTIVDDLAEVFDYRLSPNIIARFKERAAAEYERMYEDLLNRLLDGYLLHIDETRISIKGVNGYVTNARTSVTRMCQDIGYPKSSFNYR